MSKSNYLLKGNVYKSLLVFTMPIFFSLVLQILYSTVDMYVVSNYSLLEDVSAVSTASQVMNIIVGFISGLSTGITILIGQYIGLKDYKSLNKTIMNSMTMFLIIAISIMGITIIFNNNIVSLMNTPIDAIDETSSYLFVCSLGIPFIVAYNVYSSLFRGFGKSNMSFIAVLVACITNIILDVVLVVNFNMGAKGAAIATVIAQGISLLCSIYLSKKYEIIEYKYKYLKLQKDIISKVIKVGMPIALQSVLVSFSFLAITVIVNRFGINYSSAVGIVEKITGIIMLVPLSFMQSISIFVAHNYGANNIHRAKHGMYASIIMSLIFGLITSYMAYFYPNILLNIFIDDINVIPLAKDYLQAYAIDTILVCIMFSMTGYFSGLGKSMFVMIQGIIGALFIRLILVLIFSNIVPTSLFVIGLSTPIATFIQIILCIIYYMYLNKKEINNTIIE